jgi:hypothetical protein
MVIVIVQDSNLKFPTMVEKRNLRNVQVRTAVLEFEVVVCSI